MTTTTVHDEVITTADLLPTSGWLGHLIATHSEVSEAPREGWLAGGVSILSAVLGPKIRWGGEFSHVWTLLTGASATVKKTTILRGSERVVDGTREIVGDGGVRVTPLSASTMTEAWLAENWGAEDEIEADQWKQDGPPITWAPVNEADPLFIPPGQGQAGGFAAQARASLLRIYDGKISSNSKATDIPDSPLSVSLLGSTTPTHIRQSLTAAAAGTGFLGRWVFLHAEPSDIELPWGGAKVSHSVVEELASPLARVADDDYIIEDGFDIVTDEAKAYYAKWYSRGKDIQRKAVEAERTNARDADVLAAYSSVWNRYQQTAKKLAGIHAFSRMADKLTTLADLRVEVEDIEWACKMADYSLQEITRYIEASKNTLSKSRQSKVEDTILDMLADESTEFGEGIISLREVTRKTNQSNGEVQLVVKNMEHVSELVTKGERTFLINGAVSRDEARRRIERA